MSRPRFAPTDQQRRMVKSMAAYGIRQEEIAGVVSVSAKTLRRHFRAELDRGATEANTQVAQTMFWLKCRAGWRQNAPAGREAKQTPPFVVEVIHPLQPKAA
jgi:hypothetical protein